MSSPESVTLDRYVAPFDVRRLAMFRFDVVVLGSGGAGCAAALAAARKGSSVALLAKDDLSETNTRYAQGGVAAVLMESDSFASHIEDTLRVGCDLCEPTAVETVVRGGPDAIRELIELGARFDCTDDGELELGREGGHSHQRIVHAGGAATGLEIQRSLRAAVRDSADIACFPMTLAIDLVSNGDGRVTGVLCRTSNDELVVFRASQVILATGGGGQLYRETTNPAIATADGLALAFRAGATLRDLEFIQFHPTCLYIAGAARVLISEVVRGAGGILRDKTGTRFMPEYHPDKELAPRDVVSRAAFDRMVETGDTNVYLDLSGLEKDPHRLFPGISRICGYFGIDIAQDPIPVRPGAHYMIGGVLADLEGRTSVPGLWAVGECASTGLHGANRMGSNSILEALVLGRRAGAEAGIEIRRHSRAPLDGGQSFTRPTPPDDARLGVVDMIYSLKSLMWRQMGIERNGAMLEDAISKIRFWTRAVRELTPPESSALGLLNMLTVAGLASRCALIREESRGVHYRSDHPQTKPEWLVHSHVVPVMDGQEIHGAEIFHAPVNATVSSP